MVGTQQLNNYQQQQQQEKKKQIFFFLEKENVVKDSTLNSLKTRPEILRLMCRRLILITAVKQQENRIGQREN